MATTSRSWSGSLHQTFRLLPGPNDNLPVFLEADGLTPPEILKRLPYQAARAKGPAREGPDLKRYRDPRHVYSTAGLLYEGSDGRVHVTALGKATGRWLGKLTPRNAPVLGRHAAYALSACQLRTPSPAARDYDLGVQVFPFTFIWLAMLELDDRINSEELNRSIFHVGNRAELSEAIDRIRDHRASGASPSELGEEVISGERKNDRIVPWMSLASFGWLLITDKRESGGEWYTVRSSTRNVLREAAQVRRKHQEFESMTAYVEHISTAAALPLDVR